MTQGLCHLPRRLWVALGSAVLLVLVQQQLLERRPPRLLSVEPQPHSSGLAALDLSFSRPMQRRSLADASQLSPPLAHRWLGAESRLRLLLLPQQELRAPLALEIAGRDRRGRPLPPQRWNWDPRPQLLVVAEVPGGEQLQLRSPGGRWQPISAVWQAIPSLEPLADGRGVLYVAADRAGRQRLWRLELRPRSLLPGGRRTGPPQPGATLPLWPTPIRFAHLSSNRRGDLLVQVAPEAAEGMISQWIEPGGKRRTLPLEVSGPIRLLPEGEGMVVPTPDGLELRSLQGGEARPQVLPGSRDLLAFCPASGQALLMRHWPDYRRSLERVQPGAPPRTLWIGQEAVLAAGCSQSGDQVWLLLNRWRGGARNSVVRLDPGGRIVARRDLAPWQPEPGTAMSYDPVSGQLLFTVRRDPRQPARPALLDGRSLRVTVLPQPIRQARWLPAG